MNTAWAVNLSRHVEPRLVSPYRVLALVVLGFLASFGLGLGFFASDAPPHEVWVAEAFRRLPVSVADRAPERAELKADHSARFVRAITKASLSAPLPPRVWASLLLALGGSESNFDTDVVEGRCPKHRCDVRVLRSGERVFLARGAFQNHNVGPVADLWPTANGNPEQQVEMADRMLRRSLTGCKAQAPFPAHVFRAYRGGMCGFALRDEQRRLALYQRMVATPTPGGAGS